MNEETYRTHAMSFDAVAMTSDNEHRCVTDTLLRLSAGIDSSDLALLVSAFTEDASVDFRPCGRKLGLDFPVIIDRNNIVRFLSSTGKTQITSHVVTNARVQAKNGAASLRALVDATHILRREPMRRFQMMNWYDLDLIGDGPMWRTAHLTIENVWFTGDSGVMLERQI